MKDKYRDLFLQESLKHLQRIGDLIEGAVDPGEDGTTVNALFREVHSFKGMAATMGYKAMTTLAHRWEDHLGEIRDRGGELASEENDFSMKCLDRLVGMRENVEEGGDGELEWQDLFTAAVQAPPPPEQPETPPEPTFEAPEEPEEELVPPAEALTATVVLDPTCATPAARAMLIIKRFSELAPDLESSPSLSELSAGMEVGRVRLTLPGVERLHVQEVFDTLTEVSRLVFDDKHGAKPVRAGPAPLPEKLAAPETVEVHTETLDRLLEAVGELILMRGRLGRLAQESANDSLGQEVRRFAGLVRDLDDRVMLARMVPFATITGRIGRYVRQQSAELAKQVTLKVEGARIGVDKAVMFRLSGPLMHLIRNSLDHGIEPPEERLSAGKPEAGLLTLAMARERDSLILRVSDDGRGIDREAVRASALAKGLMSAEEAGALSDAEAVALLFEPGFSTRSEAGELSGRGVGLDAVKSEVSAMGGEINITTGVGEGTTFELRLPLSPSILPVLVVEAGELVLAVPVHAVEKTYEVEQARLGEEDGEDFFAVDGQRRRITWLGEVLGAAAGPVPERIGVVTVRSGTNVGHYAVDRLLREEQMFVKPLRGPWANIKGVGGYSVTPDGRIVYMLDPSGLASNDSD